MFQRIQSIFLILAFIVSLGYFFWPLALFPTGSGEIVLSIKGFSTGKGETLSLLYPYLILSGIISFLILYQLFSFKKRIRQIQTGKAIILLSVLWYGLGLIHFYTYFQDFKVLLTAKPHVSLFIPLVIIVLVILANRYIRKDEELVRSVDRIR
mgnify:CR=1 FL=1